MSYLLILSLFFLLQIIQKFFCEEIVLHLKPLIFIWSWLVKRFINILFCLFIFVWSGKFLMKCLSWMSNIYLMCYIWRVPLLGNRHFIIKSKYGKFCFTLTPDLCSLSLPVCALLCSICMTHWVILSRWCLNHNLVLRLTQHFYQVELTFAATRSICLSSASMSGSRSSIRIPQFPRKIIFRDYYYDVAGKWWWKW